MSPLSNYTQICPVGAELICANRRSDRWGGSRRLSQLMRTRLEESNRLRLVTLLTIGRPSLRILARTPTIVSDETHRFHWFLFTFSIKCLKLEEARLFTSYSIKFNHHPTTQCGPGSSIGIATDYGLDGPGSNPGRDEIFRPSRPALGPTQHHLKWLPGLSRG